MKNNFHQDPIGHMLYDYYIENKTHVKIKVKAMTGDQSTMSGDLFFRSYEAMPELEKTAMNLCSGKVLDIGAGAGCHALYLQDKGLDVSAIDVSEGAVDIMKQRGVHDARHISFFDMPPEIYDYIILMMNGIGFVGDILGLENFFIKLKEYTHPKTKIIFDSTDVSYFYEDSEQEYETALNKNYFGIFEFTMKYRKTRTTPFKWLYIDFSSLKMMAEAYGFTAEKIFQDDHHQYLAVLQNK